jgi:hypothetical protein
VGYHDTVTLRAGGLMVHVNQAVYDHKPFAAHQQRLMCMQGVSLLFKALQVSSMDRLWARGM